MNATLPGTFSTIYTAIDQPLAAAALGQLGQVASTITQPFELVGAAWALCMVVVGLWSSVPEDVFWRWTGTLARFALVTFLIANASWLGSTINGLTTSTVSELSAAVATSGQPGAGTFDGLSATIVGFVGGAGKTVSIWTPSSWIPVLMIGLCCILAYIGLLIAFAFWLIYDVVIALATSLAPVFIACWAFPLVRNYASGWLSVLVGAVTAKVLTIGLLGLLTSIINLQFGAMTAAFQADNIGLEVGSALALCADFLLVGAAAYSISRIAQAIVGGAYIATASAVVSAASAATGAASFSAGAASGAAGAVSDAAGAIGNAPSIPVFRSWSRQIGKAP